MAKRAQKSTKKKRSPPWLDAARAKLRANADARHEQEMSDAFMELAKPLMAALDEDADVAHLDALLHLVKIAWNLPIVHAAPTEPGSVGASVRREVERWLALRREDRALLVPLIQDRIRDFPHCGVLLADVSVRRAGGNNVVSLRFHGEEVPASSVLDVDEDGWPKVSRSLLELSRPARDLLTVPYGDAEAQEAIGLAMVAWNLPVLDEARAFVSEALRQEMLAAAERARKLAAPWREAFQAMVTARETRFAYDPRVIVAAPTRTQDGMIQVQAAALRLDDVEQGKR